MISQPYHDGKFDFKTDGFYEEMTDISIELSKLREIRGSRHFLFLNKTYFGLYSLFRDLGVELNTECKYRDFLRKGEPVAVVEGEKPAKKTTRKKKSDQE